MKQFSRIPECVFYVCCGSKCKARGGKHLFKQLKSEVKHSQLRKRVEVIKTGCTDRCKAGPVLVVMPGNEWHLQVDEQSATRIFHTAVECLAGK